MSEKKEIPPKVFQEMVKRRSSDTRMMFTSFSPTSSISQSTPTSGKKRPICDDNFRVSKLKTPSCSDSLEKDTIYTKEMIEKCDNKEELLKMYGNLKRNNLELEKKLQKLQLVKKHHSKIVPENLISLTEKWLTTAQSALVKLYEELPEPKPNDLLCLMNNLRIDPAIVKYDPDHPTFSLAD
ncbi:uncharacterized protein [Parasteatoda tepidariorum]|uniref:uncharacterized protein isoform X1 n=2 Tax=Parasteatoda tepidariorum TaxID=114398 RepID=UPI001C725A98|nr:uncharacterized protein LOC107451034 isoform X1 [Parasteatoda tepidariorum]